MLAFERRFAVAGLPLMEERPAHCLCQWFHPRGLCRPTGHATSCSPARCPGGCCTRRGHCPSSRSRAGRRKVICPCNMPTLSEKCVYLIIPSAGRIGDAHFATGWWEESGSPARQRAGLNAGGTLGSRQDKARDRFANSAAAGGDTAGYPPRRPDGVAAPHNRFATTPAGRVRRFKPNGTCAWRQLVARIDEEVRFAARHSAGKPVCGHQHISSLRQLGARARHHRALGITATRLHVPADHGHASRQQRSPREHLYH